MTMDYVESLKLQVHQSEVVELYAEDETEDGEFVMRLFDLVDGTTGVQIFRHGCDVGPILRLG
ncbi:MAG: hypothetical protein OEM00_10955 [Burkholderiaceae bacterium]|nr:hypothetical protein [Burkholderiaceae bacterium]